MFAGICGCLRAICGLFAGDFRRAKMARCMNWLYEHSSAAGALSPKYSAKLLGAGTSGAERKNI